MAEPLIINASTAPTGMSMESPPVLGSTPSGIVSRITLSLGELLSPVVADPAVLAPLVSPVLAPVVSSLVVVPVVAPVVLMVLVVLVVAPAVVPVVLVVVPVVLPAVVPVVPVVLVPVVPVVLVPVVVLPPALLSPTTRHPSPPMPVELSIGKVSLGPLGNTSFSGSTGMGTISLSGLSLRASGNDFPSVLLPLATMVPSGSNVMSALSPSLILKGTPRSLMVMVKSAPCAVSSQFSVSMMIWSIPTTFVPSGRMSITSPGTSTSLPIAVPPARGPFSTSCGSGSGDALSGGAVLVVVPVVPVVLVPVVLVPVVLVLVVVGVP